MQALRAISRVPRAGLIPGASSIPRRYAHQSYGNEQSGHSGSSDQTPKRNLEHPGPESPAEQGKSTSSSSQQGSGPKSHTDAKTDRGRPAIHQPESAAESEDPEVRKHNEEMRHRSDKSVNQLSEKDNKVPPTFWKGDVGDPKKK